jgi:hypothetical protein
MSQPESLESVMRTLLGQLGLPDPDVVASLRLRWDEVAGEPWAGQTEPSYVRDGELVVFVTHPSLVSMLRYATGELMRRLDAYLGEGVIESVKVLAKR